MISNLFITNFDGKTFRLSEIPSWWTVAALKERVGLEGGYDAGTLRFLFGGKHLESGRISCAVHFELFMRGLKYAFFRENFGIVLDLERKEQNAFSILCSCADLWLSG